MGVDVFRTTVARPLVGLNGSGVAETASATNSTGGAHTKPLSRLSVGHTGGNRINNALAKIDERALAIHAGLLHQLGG